MWTICETGKSHLAPAFKILRAAKRGRNRWSGRGLCQVRVLMHENKGPAFTLVALPSSWKLSHLLTNAHPPIAPRSEGDTREPQGTLGEWPPAPHTAPLFLHLYSGDEFFPWLFSALTCLCFCSWAWEDNVKGFGKTTIVTTCKIILKEQKYSQARDCFPLPSLSLSEICLEFSDKNKIVFKENLCAKDFYM